jgi:hypothetical protein
VLDDSRSSRRIIEVDQGVKGVLRSECRRRIRNLWLALDNRLGGICLGNILDRRRC